MQAAAATGGTAIQRTSRERNGRRRRVRCSWFVPVCVLCAGVCVFRLSVLCMLAIRCRPSGRRVERASRAQQGRPTRLRSATRHDRSGTAHTNAHSGRRQRRQEAARGLHTAHRRERSERVPFITQRASAEAQARSQGTSAVCACRRVCRLPRCSPRCLSALRPKHRRVAWGVSALATRATQHDQSHHSGIVNIASKRF